MKIDLVKWLELVRVWDAIELPKRTRFPFSENTAIKIKNECQVNIEIGVIGCGLMWENPPCRGMSVRICQTVVRI
jgi:hypothetical protein